MSSDKNNVKQVSSEEVHPAPYWLSLGEASLEAEVSSQNNPHKNAAAKNAAVSKTSTEFISSPLKEGATDGPGRREFLKLMGASLALGSAGCLRRPAQKIVPYVERPAEVVQGVNNYYASSYFDGAEGFNLVVTTREGRPIKLDANADANRLSFGVRGGMSARAHAHLLSLYDPDRLKAPLGRVFNKGRTNSDTVQPKWQALDQGVLELLQKARSSLGLVVGPTASPTERHLVEEFAKHFGARLYVHDPLGDGAERFYEECYGSAVRPVYRPELAKMVLSLGGDFLGASGPAVRSTALFAKARKNLNSMNELVVFESLMSLTGTNADTRYMLRASDWHLVAWALVRELGQAGLVALNSAAKEIVQSLAGRMEHLQVERGVIKNLSRRLWQHRGECLVLAGGLAGATANRRSLHTGVNYLNHLLGNNENTLSFAMAPRSLWRTSADLGNLEQDVTAGRVNTVLAYGTNWVYSAGALGRSVLPRLKAMVYVGGADDETALHSDWVAAADHPLESWGDNEFVRGVYSIQQPTIRPLYGTRARQESLLSWMQASKNSKTSSKPSNGAANLAEKSLWHAYLQNYWRRNFKSAKGAPQGGFEAFWQEWLSKGVVGQRAKGQGSEGVRFRAEAFKPLLAEVGRLARRPESDLELVLYESVGLGSGDMANVAWLQEFPDPVSKICWDNYLSVAPRVARARGWVEGDMLELDLGTGRRTVLPLHVQPGQQANTLGVAVGYGRTRAGRVGTLVGVNAFDLTAWAHGSRVSAGLMVLGVRKKELYARYALANVQGHHSIDKGFHTQHGRQIVVEQTWRQYKDDPSSGIHRHKVFSLWGEHEYKGHKWGMGVDLNSCTGCGACIVACQSENNVPVVGKEYVLQGREMHWMRVDRYFTGEPDDPGVVHMPVMCQHCDNAPCETVCPVAATVHGPEGTNDMIYNRCVGTRYCANNCPYKVRRFNWFDYSKVTSPLHMALNPEVTHRSRGVMEKCTFCIHKVTYAKHTARVRGEEFKADDVQTACQVACPAEAISFGDLNDPNSQVSRKLQEPRSYTLLEELNNKPAVHYQTKVRNAPELKGKHSDGH